MQIRLRQHPKIPFLEEAFPSESLRQEGKGPTTLSLLFFNKQLQVDIPKGSSRVAKFWALQYVFKSKSAIKIIIMFIEQVLTIVRIQRVAPRCAFVVLGRR